MRRPPFIFLLIPVLIAAGAFLLLRRGGQTTGGPVAALCPGPDAYGYTCRGGEGYAYIDAANDTRLYEDDGVLELALPFPFTFYGETYDSVTASSNGNLQFVTANWDYANRCLGDGPVSDMGAMIAPYWDDLDLALFGTLETEVIGTAPDRIFVVEWDGVPRFGSQDDRVTFEAQLFERSQDIIFLYQSVDTLDGPRGSSATIGIQEAAAGVSLQFSCNLPAVADASSLLLEHPEEPGRLPASRSAGFASDQVVMKADTQRLWLAWSQQDTTALRQIQADQLGRQAFRASSWQQADITGDGRDELVWLWHGGGQPTRLTVLTADKVLYDNWLDTRDLGVIQPVLAPLSDVTGDGTADVLVYDSEGKGLWLLRWSGSSLERHVSETACSGPVHLEDVTGDGANDAVRDGCAGRERQVLNWQGAALAPWEP